ncbi:hypothetical protein [Streptomyces litmocidini]|uniref:hypothetical protein n=1 Tax=Streptomyces litmocidini TaxID=67318 RepID=UPI0036FDF13A
MTRRAAGRVPLGTTLQREGERVTITAADATVVRRIRDGPRTASGKKPWSGAPIGAA